MEMDVGEPIRAPDWATLDLYCDRVASAVGRLSVRVFGIPGEAGLALAHHLGRALQLTNILRDLDEDAGVGRLYLPREALRAAGISATDPASGAVPSGARHKPAPPSPPRRANIFARPTRSWRRCPRRNARAPRIMAQAYRVDPRSAGARGWAAPRQRCASASRNCSGFLRRVYA